MEFSSEDSVDNKFSYLDVSTTDIEMLIISYEIIVKKSRRWLNPPKNETNYILFRWSWVKQGRLQTSVKLRCVVALSINGKRS